MTINFSIKSLTTSILAVAVFAVIGLAQVTTSEITGSISDQAGAAVAGARVTAVHEPSGTKYTTVTNDSGRYTLPAVRIGGPYSVTANHTGFAEQKQDGFQAGLGGSSTVDFVLSVEGVGAEVTVTTDDTFNDARTGASTSIKATDIGTLPTLSRSKQRSAAQCRSFTQAALSSSRKTIVPRHKKRPSKGRPLKLRLEISRDQLMGTPWGIPGGSPGAGAPGIGASTFSSTSL
jgi:hypothetical protein